MAKQSPNGSVGTVVSGSISLNTGAAGGTLLPALPAKQHYFVFDIIMTTNDTAQPLVTLADSAAAPNQLLKAYVVNSSPTAAYSSIGTPTAPGAAALVTASSTAITAAKTIEIRVTALVVST